MWWRPACVCPPPRCLHPSLLLVLWVFNLTKHLHLEIDEPLSPK